MDPARFIFWPAWHVGCPVCESTFRGAEIVGVQTLEQLQQWVTTHLNQAELTRVYDTHQEVDITFAYRAQGHRYAEVTCLVNGVPVARSYDVGESVQEWGPVV
jgi:hypothetical protein